MTPKHKAIEAVARAICAKALEINYAEIVTPEKLNDEYWERHTEEAEAALNETIRQLVEMPDSVFAEFDKDETYNRHIQQSVTPQGMFRTVLQKLLEE